MEPAAIADPDPAVGSSVTRRADRSVGPSSGNPCRALATNAWCRRNGHCRFGSTRARRGRLEVQRGDVTEVLPDGLAGFGESDDFGNDQVARPAAEDVAQGGEHVEGETFGALGDKSVGLG